MPITCELKPEIIKHLRNHKRISQYCIAKAVGITERGYQKIEYTGRTSPETAAALAKEFETSLAYLQGKEELKLQSPYWFYTSLDEKQNKAGRILQDDLAFSRKVKDLMMKRAPYRPGVTKEISATLSTNGQVNKLTVVGDRSDTFWMQWRRVELDSDRGLLWSYESDLETEYMTSMIDQIMYESTTRYTRNDEPMPPPGMPEIFLVDVVTWEKVDAQKPWLNRHFGWQRFDDETALTKFILQFMSEFKPRSYSLRPEIGNLTIDLNPHIHFRGQSVPLIPGTALVVRRCWINGQGEVSGPAPWHKRSIEFFKYDIEKRFKGDFNQRTISQFPKLPLEPGFGEAPRQENDSKFEFKLAHSAEETNDE